MSCCRSPAPALNEQRRRSNHADHWSGYPPRLRRGDVAWDDGKLKTDWGALTCAGPFFEAFAKEAFEG